MCCLGVKFPNHVLRTTHSNHCGKWIKSWVDVHWAQTTMSWISMPQTRGNGNVFPQVRLKIAKPTMSLTRPTMSVYDWFKCAKPYNCRFPFHIAWECPPPQRPFSETKLSPSLCAVLSKCAQFPGCGVGALHQREPSPLDPSFLAGVSAPLSVISSFPPSPSQVSSTKQCRRFQIIAFPLVYRTQGTNNTICQRIPVERHTS